MKLAIVVQRYGADIAGGAELHARYVAERLAGHAEVEVLTTCAVDYITWRNELPAGDDDVRGLRVRRFPVAHERDVVEFGRRSIRVFDEQHSFADELKWLDSEGPTSPALVEYVSRQREAYDYFIVFSYRYYHAYQVARVAGNRSLLVPTAERDPAIGLALFGPVFRGVRAVMYNSQEEQAMINGIAGNQHVPGVVVGVGSELPETTEPLRFRKKFGIPEQFILYLGRIDENKGCKELFDFTIRFNATHPGGLTLVLIGNAVMPVPRHPRIRHLGFLDDQDKFDALAAADLLVMPSYYESLSMVAIEAWGLGRPVLANAKCDVLHGQCLRSNAGLFYDNYDEFAGALRLLLAERELRESIGRHGRSFYARHYAWPVIERRYLTMLERLDREDAPAAVSQELAGVPGWFERRRRTIGPSRARVEALPTGPVRPSASPAQAGPTSRRPPRRARRRR